MEAVIDEPLGDIAGPDSFLGLDAVTEDNFMHGRAFVRQIVVTLELFADVVGVEHGIFSSLAEPVGPVGHDVSQRAHMHAEITVEHTYPANRLRTVVVETQ